MKTAGYVLPHFYAICYLGILSLGCCSSSFLSDLHIPKSHIPYLFRTSTFAERCKADKKCRAKYLDASDRCWGYEKNCSFGISYSSGKITCEYAEDGIDSSGQYIQSFWEEGDFRKLKDVAESLKPICSSTKQEGSYLECSDHLRFCRAKNIYFDFRNLNAKTSRRYRNDVIREGNVGGRCDSFDIKLLSSRADEKSYLQSWSYELEHFRSYQDFKVDGLHCDVVFDRPTIIMKLDASVSMYHHFCDFVNLYASQHLNGSFDMDVDVVWWDTFGGGFVDAYFGATWRVFSKRSPVELISLDGKKVCFRNALLPLLARQKFGLYYNMPLISGCSGSGLFEAFSEHVLFRLGIKQDGPLLGKIRITFLSRSTKFRRVINENEICEALRKLPNVQVQKVDYNRNYPFISQLTTTHNTDILISMHGSGLTHLLFLPAWAAVFEIYNCQDVYCYLDLARLRGVQYFTWEDETKLEAVGDYVHPHTGKKHPKFLNYLFDVDEFIRLVKKQIDYVRQHPVYRKKQKRLRKTQAEEEL